MSVWYLVGTEDLVFSDYVRVTLLSTTSTTLFKSQLHQVTSRTHIYKNYSIFYLPLDLMNLVSSFRFAFVFLCFAPGATSQHNARLPESDLALALGGGGFLSVTDMAGLTAGLLSVLMKEDPALVLSDNALFESGLFDRVGSISSISGGSWFAVKARLLCRFQEND